MPIIQIGWDKIKEKLDDVTAIYTLTHRQASLLLSLTEQLDWRKTFRTDDYDFEDIDDLQLEIDDLRLYLTMPVSLQDLIGYIDEVETLLESIRDLDRTSSNCCDGTGPITETNSTDLDQTDSGDTPATYGDEPVTDYDDWQDLICGTAHAYVDLLKETNNELNDIVRLAAIGVGAIASLMALLSGAGILLVVGYGAAASLVSGLIAGAVATTFEGLDDDIEDNREEIVCAILNGGYNDLADAVETAVSATAWTLWFSLIDYESAHATMITGENSNGVLIPRRGMTCDCTEQPEGELAPNYHWRDNTDGWTLQSPVTYTDLEQTVDGFEIDGVITYNVSEFPQSHTYWKSDNFTWPGGQVDIKIRARSSSSGSAAIRNTYVVVAMRRASDDALLDQYSTIHGSPDTDYNWSEQTDYTDDTNHSEQEVYLTVAIDGTDGYGGRYVDYVSCRVRP